MQVDAVSRGAETVAKKSIFNRIQSRSVIDLVRCRLQMLDWIELALQITEVKLVLDVDRVLDYVQTVPS